MCDRSYPKELAFKYLEDLKSEYDRIDGPKIETAARLYEFGTFMHKNGKLYQKETSSLIDMCLERLTVSLNYVNSMPEELLERLLGLCTSEEVLRLETNNDIYSLTDPVWKRFYQHEFGSKETELVHQNLGMYDTSFKWSECFNQKLCSEGVYNKYPFAPMAPKVRRHTKLLTNMYTPSGCTGVQSLMVPHVMVIQEVQEFNR
ncbi:Longin domain-containing protein [Raphanus sativus]|nr:Longin domain-containing protein [Raphanus sativus]